jgi:hypothetical protein
MFDIFFNSLMGLQQAGFILAGIVLLLLGGALVADALRWWIFAERVEGTVIGVREKLSSMSKNGAQMLYYPVYRYSLVNGEMYEATSDTGSNLTGGKQTGYVTKLLVFPDDPTNVRDARSFSGLFFSLLFIIPGVIFAKVGAGQEAPLPYTIFFLFAIFTYGAAKFRKLIIPKEERRSPLAWKEQRRKRRREEMEKLPLRPLEDILRSPENKKLQADQNRATGWLVPIMMLSAVALCGVSLLEKDGTRAHGRVVRLEKNYSSEGTTYCPVVEYQTRQESFVTFKDNICTNLPQYKTGEKVTVLYLPHNPYKKVMIDRGIWNWAIPGAILAFATLLFAVCFYRIRRRQQSEIL